MTAAEAARVALEEYERATRLFGEFNSQHEGYAILLEEVDELWDAVKLNHRRHPDRAERIRREAVQVAAMALRFLVDCTEPGSEEVTL